MNPIKRYITFFQQNRVAKHILFWVFMLLISVPKGFLISDHSVEKILLFYSSFLFCQIIASYYFAYFVIPRFLLEKKYIIFVLSTILGVYFFSVLARVLMVYFVEALVREGDFSQESIAEILLDVKKLLGSYVPNVFNNVLVFLFVKYFSDYRKFMNRDLQFQKEKSENELRVLKAQLNPHFLFNTLNNIYSLSLLNSPQTSSAVGKLSEILDHILYRCNASKVPLSSEVELLENYMELEKLRYDDRLKIQCTKEILYEKEIPPLLLLSLVENAFKHGAGEDSGCPEISMKIYSGPDSFTFYISNTIPEDYLLNEERIGLSNIKKQLELLYGKHYYFSTGLKEKKFEAILQIF